MYRSSGLFYHCAVGDALTEHGVIEKIFFSFQATEMGLTSKWDRIQQEMLICAMFGRWTVAGWDQEGQKNAEKLLI